MLLLLLLPALFLRPAARDVAVVVDVVVDDDDDDDGAPRRVGSTLMLVPPAESTARAGRCAEVEEPTGTAVVDTLVMVVKRPLPLRVTDFVVVVAPVDLVDVVVTAPAAVFGRARAAAAADEDDDAEEAEATAPAGGSERTDEVCTGADAGLGAGAGAGAGAADIDGDDPRGACDSARSVMSARRISSIAFFTPLWKLEPLMSCTTLGLKPSGARSRPRSSASSVSRTTTIDFLPCSAISRSRRRSVAYVRETKATNTLLLLMTDAASPGSLRLSRRWPPCSWWLSIQTRSPCDSRIL